MTTSPFSEMISLAGSLVWFPFKSLGFKGPPKNIREEAAQLN
jgi:hypothetical protein